MNSEEGISLAKMAVAVLLVVLVIGAVVAIVYAAYSWFNGGTEKLGDQVTSIGASAYSQYDDTQITGNDVLAALKSFRDADFAVVICNNNNYTSENAHFAPGNPQQVASNTARNYCARLRGVKAGERTTGEGTAQDGTFIVQFSTAEADATASDAHIVYNTTSNRFETTNLDYQQSGTTQKNTNFSPTTDSSFGEAFVRTTGTFYSKLLYSQETGDACGVIFFQVE